MSGIRGLVCLSVVLSFCACWSLNGSETVKEPTSEATEALDQDVTQGALRIVGAPGGLVECPLKHTSVDAKISGFIARVNVTQTFVNPSSDKIEAVYIFPLPHKAAVDAMTMHIGDRKIKGLIKRRDEARQIYDQAIAQGQTAALLEQERPNIFTQTVGNIDPGQEVRIEISYVDVLRYDVGTYEFQFPMVVGPRYNPGRAISSPQEIPANLQGKVSPPVANTDRVPDAQRISPPVLKPKFRNGHDVSLTVELNAGVPIQNLSVANHRASVDRNGEQRAKIVLASDDSLPNKDFVLRYDVVGKKPEMAVLAHTGSYSGDARAAGGGYFMLMIQPQEDERLTKSPPREMVFLVDVSGSMTGAPTAKVIETMQHMLRLCREQDTVQVITFANESQKLFDKPVPVNPENIDRALGFTAGLRGSGGTEMLKGVKMAIDEPIDAERLRIVVMLTDGYIGNEAEIIEHVGKHCGDHVRFWCVGIGQAPNMFLVDGVARQGGGMGKQHGLNGDSAALSQEIMTRIQRAQLANVKIDWGEMRVSQTFPARLPELWAGRPVILVGRYSGGAESATIRVNGTIEGEPVEWPLTVTFPQNQPENDVLASVWARQKIEDLMQQAYYQTEPAIEEEVTAIALDYRLMSQYTSFVAVDEKEAADTQQVAQPPRRMLVPVPLPEGTRWEGFFCSPVDAEEELERLGDATRPNLLFDSLSANTEFTEGRGEMKGLRRNFGRESYGLSLGAVSATSMKQPSPRFRVTGPVDAIGEVLQKKVNRESRDQLRFAPSGVRQLRLQHEPAAFGLVAAPAQEPALESAVTWVAALTQPQIEALAKTVRDTFEAAQQLHRDNKLEDAVAAYRRAYLLSMALTDYQPTSQSVPTVALEKLLEARMTLIRNWAKQLPATSTRLDLVIKNQDVASAVQSVAKAAGVRVELIDGSVADSEKLLGQAAHVNYLDLRGATLAEALDWLLLPRRMDWQLNSDGKGIVVATVRRTAADSGWIYDVSMLASPLLEEFNSLSEGDREAAAKKSIEDFVSVLKTSLPQTDSMQMVWYSPGQLLLIGSDKQHAALEKTLANLSDPNARLQGDAAKIHQVVLRRVEKRRPVQEKILETQAQAELAKIHRQYGVRLLSAAVAGQSDPEALTQLQIAWSNPGTLQLLKGNSAGYAFQSAWTIQESARLRPNDSELTKLAATTKGSVKKAAADLVSEASRNTQKAVDSIAAIVYAGLCSQDDRELREKCAALLQPIADRQSNAPTKLAAAILRESSPQRDQELLEIVKTGVRGEDAVFLLSWICRQSSDQVWSAFRLQSSELLGNQPLSGELIVLVNRLDSMR